MANGLLSPCAHSGTAGVNTTSDPALRNAETPKGASSQRKADRHRTKADRHTPGYMRAYMAAWRARRRAEQGAVS